MLIAHIIYYLKNIAKKFAKAILGAIILAYS
jgi:hypothetical protein